MSVMIDMIGATVLVGMLMVIIMNVNINMNTETSKATSEYHTQTEDIQLARILEYDLYKMAYGVPKSGAVLIADTSRLKFKTNLKNVSGSSDIVEYILGAKNTVSTNPRDYQMSRIENLATTFISYSVTRFKLLYYDTHDSLMPTPISGAELDSIESVRVFLSLESPEPIDNSYAGAYYEKLLYPRNLR